MTATSRMTVVQANEMAMLFIRRHFPDGVSGARIFGAWNWLESHLTATNPLDRHPDAAAIRILAGKWTAFLRRNGFSR